MKKLNVGMIGYGFMGRAHSNAYRQVNRYFKLDTEPVLKAACARNEVKLAEFAANWGWESTETDWRKLVERDDIDVIDIGSPNNTHFEIALAAAANGKMILCEKPLAMDAEQARVAAADVAADGDGDEGEADAQGGDSRSGAERQGGGRRRRRRARNRHLRTFRA